jgi:putative ABC transport system permease protein
MLLNYFKIALRFLAKNRMFSFINCVGLTLGFLCFILIGLYLHDELSFDLFHKDAERIYRVIQHEKQEDGAIRAVAPVAVQIGPQAVKQLPEVEQMSQVFGLGRVTLGNDPANRNYERLMTTDPEFLTFFNFPLIQGDPATALRQPDAIVITEKLAMKYFGNQPAIGKRLWSVLTRNRAPVEFTVTGIMKDFPKNSHIQIDIIFSEPTWRTIFPWYDNFVATDWTSNSDITYLKLKAGADPVAAAAKITELTRTHYPKDREFKSTFSLQPIKDIHLYSDNIQGNEINANGIKPFYLYLFASVAFLVLLIACLNYMNLSTAAAYKRTREIGTRKTLGAQKLQLISQFAGEAIIMSAVSLLLAITLLEVMLPAVNSFTQKEMSLTALPLNWVFALGIVMLLAGIISSVYPAYIIARVMPSEALKKEVKLGNRTLPVRKMLVAGQFAISIMMIASTLVIYQQLEYMRTKDLGFSMNNLVVIDINSDRLRRNFENVKAEFAKLSEVQSISASTRVPGEWKSFPISTVRTQASPNGKEMIYVGIDQDFLSTYKIKLLEGRNFLAGTSDSLKVILTKLAVEQLGLKDPVGEMIEIPGARWGGQIDNLDRPFRAEVIGVADDFHFESFRQKMMPVVFAFPNTPIQRIDYYTLNINSSNLAETIEKLREVNRKIDADNPLEYNILASQFERFYQNDRMRGQVFLSFSMVIVVIACLGLFALVSYSIESRTKEIGIRKVLGASVRDLVSMVSREFLVLVLIGGVVATPVAWYVTNTWLEDFAYKVSPGVGVFLLAGVIALVIAGVTIGFRAVRAAVMNPVESLRTE